MRMTCSKWDEGIARETGRHWPMIQLFYLDKSLNENQFHRHTAANPFHPMAMLRRSSNLSTATQTHNSVSS